jgi:hypothetical protein
MNRRNMLRGLLGVIGMMDIAHASSNAERIGVGGSTLDVFIDSDQFELGRTPLLDWVTSNPLHPVYKRLCSDRNPA